MRDITERTAKLMRAMEREYDTIRARYAFSCEGCADNCCTQRFFHYTLTEYLFLLEGLRAATLQARREFITRAREVVAQYPEELGEGRLRPLMCPVNINGLCALYAHRPMICRLHGLPHRLTKPGGSMEIAAGCERFNAANPLPERMLDRTPFYTKLARIEADLRQRLKQPGKLRMTTAEMLVKMSDEDPGLIDE